MIVHINVGVAKKDGKWVGHWKAITKTAVSEVFEQEEQDHEILANRREELERKLDKALRLAFPKASYIVQHREPGETVGPCGARCQDPEQCGI